MTELFHEYDAHVISLPPGGHRALHEAYKKRYEAVVKLLFDHGADILEKIWGDV